MGTDPGEPLRYWLCGWAVVLGFGMFLVISHSQVEALRSGVLKSPCLPEFSSGGLSLSSWIFPSWEWSVAAHVLKLAFTNGRIDP